ncbi:MAG: hypothetical protein V1902_00345 [Candidatus Falkowbacteria bacterium]
MFKKFFEKIGSNVGDKTVVEKPAPAKRIDKATTWDELRDAISSDSQKIVDAVRRREIPIISLTREQNLRETVKLLLIREARDFEDLFVTLDFIQSLHGSGKVYIAKDLKSTINIARRIVEAYPVDAQKIVESHIVLNNITRACGLRDKVSELFMAGNK